MECHHKCVIFDDLKITNLNVLTYRCSCPCPARDCNIKLLIHMVQQRASLWGCYLFPQLYSPTSSGLTSGDEFAAHLTSRFGECQSWYFFNSSTPAQNTMSSVGGQFSYQHSLAPALISWGNLEVTPQTVNPTDHGAGIGLKTPPKIFVTEPWSTKGILFLREK